MRVKELTPRERAVHWLARRGVMLGAAGRVLDAGRAYFQAGVNRCNRPDPLGRYDKALERAEVVAALALVVSGLEVSCEAGSLFMRVLDKDGNELVLPQ